MGTEFKHRRGTTTEHSTFTGGAGEITVDTDKNTAVVHDGATAGGVPLAKASEIPTGALASLDSVDASTIDDNSVGAAELNVTGNGTSGQALTSDGDGTMTWATVGGGGTMRAQLFTAPGTWTKPANTNWCKVHVYGGGGGGSSNGSGGTGGTSSFGSFVTANGGTGATFNTNPQAGGNVSTGGGAIRISQAAKLNGNNGTFPLGSRGPWWGYGVTSPSNQSMNVNNIAWSNSNEHLPGAGGYGTRFPARGQIGGYGSAYCPVNGPVSVTRGNGGNTGGQGSSGGVRGTVLVEWVE